MGLWQTAQRALTRQTFSQTFAPDGSGNMDFFFNSPRSKAGAEVTPRKALQLTAVYACINLLADLIASFDLELVREVNGVCEPIKVPSWAVQPNIDTSYFNFMHMAMVSVLVHGNTFIYVERELGVITGLYILHPEFVQTEWLDGQKVFRVAGQLLINNWDIIHVPGFVMPGDLLGLSPIGLAKESIGLGLTAEEFGSTFFANGAHMSGIVEVPGEFDETSAKKMAKSLNRNHSGDNAHLPGVLTNGAQWKPISVPPEQAQFLETRKFQKADIALLYRVPAYMVDPSVTSSWGTGITEQNRGLAQYTASPWVMRFEQALSVLVPRGQSFRFNMDTLLRGTMTERYTAYAIGTSNGFVNADEVRAQEGDAPLPKGLGKKFYHPANLVEVGAPPPPVVAPGGPPDPTDSTNADNSDSSDSGDNSSDTGDN